MADVAIISAIYGDYDIIKAPIKLVGLDVEWILVTDQQLLIDEQEALASLGSEFEYGNDKWKFIYSPSDEIPVRAAKMPKMLPWRFTDAPASIWIDSSCQVFSPSFAAESVSYTSPTTPMAMFRHSRDCLYDEGNFSHAMFKYKDEPIPQQLASYRAHGHPEHWGLWTATVIARQHTEFVKMISEDWYYEIDTWCHQDQIALPYVLRNRNYRPNLFPGTSAYNSWLSWGLHRR